MAALEAPSDELAQQGAASSPIVRFARFVSGGRKVELFDARTSDLEFFAISHVWGPTKWIHVPILQRKIKASKQKAAFINKGLAKLVGSTPFWMDTITVDQTDSEAVIATVQSIPAIFRDATKTIALREREGFIDCCSDAIRDFSSLDDLRRKLEEHSRTHFRRVYGEAYLERLWTFQECFLSHTMEFVLYGPSIPKKERKMNDNNSSQTTSRALVDSLYTVAHAYSTDKEKMVEFMKAYISCGTVARSALPTRTQNEDIFTGSFKEMHQSSSRSATMPRDYVFATMPQFPWYHYPENAVNMDFSEIFLDLAQQAENAKHPFTVRLTRSMTESLDSLDAEEAWHPSRKQPKPESLGDFLKLIGQPHRRLPMKHHTSDIVIRTMGNESVGGALLLVAGAMRHSNRLWHESYLGGELSKFGSDPEHPSGSFGGSDTSQLFEKILTKRAVSDKENEELPAEPAEAENQGLTELGQHVENTSSEPSEDEGPTESSNGNLVDDEAEWLTASESSDDEGELKSKRRVHPTRMRELRFEAERVMRTSRERILTQARKVLCLLWSGYGLKAERGDAQSLIAELEKDATPLLVQAILLLAAMVGCQMPLSAAEWVLERFTPVKVMFADFDVLGLIADHAKGPHISIQQEMQCFGRHLAGGDGCDLVIVDPETDMPVGLLPDMFDGHWELVEHGNYLYPNGVATVSESVNFVFPYMLGLEEITSD